MLSGVDSKIYSALVGPGEGVQRWMPRSVKTIIAVVQALRGRALVAALTALLLGGWAAVVLGVEPAETGLQMAQDSVERLTTPTRPAIGYVDIDKAVKAHPLYPKLQEVQNQLTQEQERWDRFVDKVMAQFDPSGYTERLARLHVSQIEALESQIGQDIQRYREKLQAELAEREKSITEKAEQEWENRRESLKKELRENQQRLQDDMNRRLNEEADAVRNRYQKQILNLQVELILGRLSNERKQDKLGKLQNVQAELEGHLKKLVDEYNTELETEQKRLQQLFEERLEKAREEISQKAEREVAEARRQAEASFQRYVSGKKEAMASVIEDRENRLSRLEMFLSEDVGEHGGAWSQVVQMQKKIEQDLIAQEDSLLQTIMFDVKAASQKVAADLGLEAVLTEEQFSAKAADVTAPVIQVMKTLLNGT